MTDTGRTCAVDVKTSLTSDYVVLGESPCGLPLHHASVGPCAVCGRERLPGIGSTGTHKRWFGHFYLGPLVCAAGHRAGGKKPAALSPQTVVARRLTVAATTDPNRCHLVVDGQEQQCSRLAEWFTRPEKSTDPYETAIPTCGRHLTDLLGDGVTRVWPFALGEWYER